MSEAKELCRIIVPWDVARTAPNARRSHWDRRIGNSEAHRAREWAHIAWKQAGCPRARGRVRVILVARRRRAMDWDNIVAGAKPVLDGLFKDAITPDDSPACIESISVAQDTRRIHHRSESLEVVVYEVTEEKC
jgi:hypothetical protein